MEAHLGLSDLRLIILIIGFEWNIEYCRDPWLKINGSLLGGQGGGVIGVL